MCVCVCVCRFLRVSADWVNFVFIYFSFHFPCPPKRFAKWDPFVCSSPLARGVVRSTGVSCHCERSVAIQVIQICRRFAPDSYLPGSSRSLSLPQDDTSPWLVPSLYSFYHIFNFMKRTFFRSPLQPIIPRPGRGGLPER